MTDNSPPQLPIRRIAVRIQVGEHMMSASDDPLFLGIHGAQGREFRLAFKHGKSLRRGQQDRFVFGSPDDPEVNAAHPELNDPTNPALDAAAISGVFLRKGFDPIPNVRAIAEMDDRLEIIEAEVEFIVAGDSEPVRHLRRGPVWLGLVCGLSFELPAVQDRS